MLIRRSKVVPLGGDHACSSRRRQSGAIAAAIVAAAVILVRVAPRHRTAARAGHAKRAKAAPAAIKPGPSVVAALRPEERAVIIWAGMLGAVIVAGAQPLPGNAPQRATLTLVAFAVAAGTLLLQAAHCAGW